MPSTSFLFSLTMSSLLHSMHRTSSLPWHIQPLLAHSISFTGSGLGVQSVSSWKLASRLMSWSRSPGQYFGCASLAGAGGMEPLGVHLRKVMFDMVVCPFDGGVLSL